MSGGNATGGQVSQETRGKGERLMGEREIDTECDGRDPTEEIF